jgi:hypothetical protein
MKDDVFIILSYTDNDIKTNMLKQCISKLRKYNRKIILSTHSAISEEIMDKVDYVIYDKENPMITPKDDNGRSNGYNWWDSGDFYLGIAVPNHTYCVLTLMQNGVRLANSLGYKNSHIVNYDSLILDENIINKHNINLVDNDVVCYIDNDDNTWMDLTFFSVRNLVFLNSFDEFNTKEKYMNYWHERLLEHFLLNVLSLKTNKIKTEYLHKLLKHNQINILSMHDFKGFGSNYIDLVKDNLGNFNLCIRNNDNLEEVKINKIRYKIKPNINLIKITEDQLRQGIMFKSKKFKKYFDINENFIGNCDIRDSSQLNIIEL